MRATFWGTRGSLASPGLDTIRYGGNTCCVEVRTDGDDLIVLDAGTGIRRLGQAIPDDAPRVDVLLSHLHMDHIQGLGFFDCLYRDGFPVHLWGPASTTMSLRTAAQPVPLAAPLPRPPPRPALRPDPARRRLRALRHRRLHGVLQPGLPPGADGRLPAGG